MTDNNLVITDIYNLKMAVIIYSLSPIHSSYVLLLMSVPCTFLSHVMSVPCTFLLLNIHWCDIPVCMFTVQVQTKPVYSTGAHNTRL